MWVWALLDAPASPSQRPPLLPCASPARSTAKQRDYDSPNLLLTVRSRGGGSGGGGGRGGMSELKSLNLNPALPHQLALAAGDPFVRIYDRRMLTPGGWCGANGMSCMAFRRSSSSRGSSRSSSSPRQPSCICTISTCDLFASPARRRPGARSPRPGTHAGPGAAAPGAVRGGGRWRALLPHAPHVCRIWQPRRQGEPGGGWACCWQGPAGHVCCRQVATGHSTKLLHSLLPAGRLVGGKLQLLLIQPVAPSAPVNSGGGDIPWGPCLLLRYHRGSSALPCQPPQHQQQRRRLPPAAALRPVCAPAGRRGAGGRRRRWGTCQEWQQQQQQQRHQQRRNERPAWHDACGSRAGKVRRQPPPLQQAGKRAALSVLGLQGGSASARLCVALSKTPGLCLPTASPTCVLYCLPRLQYYEAVKRYSEAIRLAPWAPVLYTNRALALLQRGWEGDALCALRDTETGGWAWVGCVGWACVGLAFGQRGCCVWCACAGACCCLFLLPSPLLRFLSLNLCPALFPACPPCPTPTPAAVCLDPTWHKAHYRRLQALLAAGMLQVRLAAIAARPWRCASAAPGTLRRREPALLCSPLQAASPVADYG